MDNPAVPGQAQPLPRVKMVKLHPIPALHWMEEKKKKGPALGGVTER